MKRKLVGLAGFLLLFAGAPYVAGWFGVGAASVTERGLNFSSDLLPTSVGTYDAVRQWRVLDPAASGDFTTIYSDAADGSIVRIDVLLNIAGMHSALACMLVKGDAPVERSLRKFTTTSATTVFDTAIFLSGKRLGLIGSTNCWSWGCDEAPVWPFVRPETGLRLLFSPPEAPVPVTISLDGGALARNGKAARAKLMERFDRFASALDLGPVRGYCARRREGRVLSGP